MNANLFFLCHWCTHLGIGGSRHVPEKKPSSTPSSTEDVALLSHSISLAMKSYDGEEFEAVEVKIHTQTHI